ncbi:MAG: TrmH family RNA methyltransferase [Candidatus Dojkabacteria bacterium]
MRQLRKKEAKKFFKHMRERGKDIRIILENIQYPRNVAGIFRTADAAGVSHVYLTGITPGPPFAKQLQHISRGKEQHVHYSTHENTADVTKMLRKDKFLLIAVELTKESIPLERLADLTRLNDRICFIFGSEMHGITKDILKNHVDQGVYIPMYGKGASLNVSISVGIVLYSV